MFNLQSMFDLFQKPCHACAFPKEANTPTIFFEALLIILALALIWALSKNDKMAPVKFFAAFWGATIFEILTQSMWHNYNLGQWAYISADVSWVLGLGWAIITTGCIYLIENKMGLASRWKKFLATIGLFTVFGLAYESLGLLLGYRQYSQEVLNILTKINIPFINVPIEALYFLPVTGALLISFFYFWEQWLGKNIAVPVRRMDFIKTFFVALTAVTIFDVMTHPMIKNVGFPSWGYILGNMNIVLTASGALLLAAIVWLIDYLFKGKGQYFRFTSYVYAALITAVPLEMYFYSNGMRIYGEEFSKVLTGLFIPYTNIPVEVAFGTLLYVMFVMPFISYWSYIFSRK